MGYWLVVGGRIRFYFFFVVLVSVDIFGDFCSIVFVCVFRVSDLFLSRFIIERFLMDLFYF